MEALIGLGLLIATCSFLAFMFALAWVKPKAPPVNGEMAVFALISTALMFYFGVAMFTPTGMTWMELTSFFAYAGIILMISVLTFAFLTIILILVFKGAERFVRWHPEHSNT